MLSRIDRKVRHMLTGGEDNLDIPIDIQKNPLVSYLKLFQNQHKVISILYKGLITAFTGFVLLLSLLIFNVLQNELVPLWGALLLGLTDLFLLFGVYKAFRELRRYRGKSTQITEQIFTYLKKDLDKLQDIQVKNTFIKDSQKRIKQSTQRSASKALQVEVKDYEGWDYKLCTHCGASIEMLAETCPVCRQAQKKYLEN